LGGIISRGKIAQIKVYQEFTNLTMASQHFIFDIALPVSWIELAAIERFGSRAALQNIKLHRKRSTKQ
jgi:hypothetical protein